MRRTLIDAFKSPLTEPAPRADDAELVALGAEVRRATSLSLGRSLSVRHLDSGSCNACELEIHALNNPFYDLERFGVRFVASPRHADALLVTGPVTRNMLEAVNRTYDATPSPKWVIASGACARDGHVFKGSYAVVGGLGEVLPVDIYIPGCPPSPTALLDRVAPRPVLALVILERRDQGAIGALGDLRVETGGGGVDLHLGDDRLDARRGADGGGVFLEATGFGDVFLPLRHLFDDLGVDRVEMGAHFGERLTAFAAVDGRRTPIGRRRCILGERRRS